MMSNLESIKKENFYELTNMYKVQMGNLKSKIILLIAQIAVGCILFFPMMQIKDMPRANILRGIINTTFVIYIILSIFAVGLIIALLMKKNVDILVNISAIFTMISTCAFFYLGNITNFVHENYKYIFVLITIITMIIPIVNGLIYYKKAKNKLLNGVYRKGNYKYKFNKKLLLFLIPVSPLAVPIGNRGRVIEMIFGEVYLLLALNYSILIISIVISYFVVNRIFFIYQLRNNMGKNKIKVKKS